MEFEAFDEIFHAGVPARKRSIFLAVVRRLNRQPDGQMPPMKKRKKEAKSIERDRVTRRRYRSIDDTRDTCRSRVPLRAVRKLDARTHIALLITE